MLRAGNRCGLILHKRGNHSYIVRTAPLFDGAIQQTAAFLARCGLDRRRAK
jgi:hypothetical protein